VCPTVPTPCLGSFNSGLIVVLMLLLVVVADAGIEKTLLS